MSSWSLLYNADPPISRARVESRRLPAALPLLKCSIAMVISFIEGSSSNSALNGCWRMRVTVGSWTTRSALKQDWKCSDQRLRMEVLWKALAHLHCARDCGDWAISHFESHKAFAGGCCKGDGRRPSSQDKAAELVGPGGMISSSLAVPESLDCSRQTSLCSSWWKTPEPLQMSAEWHSSVNPRVFQGKCLLGCRCLQT